MFAYCNNNPVHRADKSGEFWNVVIGAAVGAAINFGVSVVSQWLDDGWSNIDWRRVGVATTAGAISGALAATGIPVGGQMIANGLIGAVSAGVDTYLETNGTATLSKYITKMATGGLIGIAGGALGNNGTGTKHLANHAGRLLSKSRNAIHGLKSNGLKATIKTVSNAGRYYYSQIATASIQAGKAAIMPIAISNIPNAVNSILQVF